MQVEEIERFDPGHRMSQIVTYGALVFLCGQVADKRPGSVTDQANEIFRKIDKYLERAGSSKSKLLAAQVWLSDIRFYDEFNSAWDAWVDPKNTPARSCCQTTLASPDMFVEVTIFAGR